MNRCLFGDCRDSMRELIAQGTKVQMCVTSPPYFGLRDYGTAQWEGGDVGCDHKPSPEWIATQFNGPTARVGGATQAAAAVNRWYVDGACRACGARRIDKQLGLESTPEEYVANMVEVFRLVRELLADDGVLFLNIGDSYASDIKGSGGKGKGLHADRATQYDKNQHFAPRRIQHGLKPKDLIGIPWRIAFALQADGWYLRQEIIWHKPNPMPESVTDRCTKAHESIFLLAKSQRYFFDAQAIAELADTAGKIGGFTPNAAIAAGVKPTGNMIAENGRNYIRKDTRNRRSVWTIATAPYNGAHFATFPTALVEPCILAGTSQKGHCRVCGKGWVRVVEHQAGDAEAHERPKRTGGMQSKTSTLSLSGNGSREWALRGGKSMTIGWQPSCSCSSNLEPVPGIVFDPFLGSGTVAQVAQALGRNWLGCELNEQYRPLQERRTAQQGLMLA